MEASPQPSTTKQSLHSAKTIPNGNTQHHYSVTTAGHVGDVPGFTRCLLAYPDTTSGSSLPLLPLSGGGLPVQITSVRVIDRPQGFHQGNSTDTGVPKEKGGSGLRLSRRLVNRRGIQKRSGNQNRQSDFPIRGVGLVDQPKEIHTTTHSVDCVSGSEVRPRQGYGFSNTGTPGQLEPIGRNDSQQTVHLRTNLASGSRTDGKFSRRVRTVSTQNAAIATTPIMVLQSGNGPLEHYGPVHRGTQTLPVMVDNSSQCGVGEIFSRTPSTNDSHNRCIVERMGGNLEQSVSLGCMVEGRITASHQCSRNDRGPSSDTTLGRPPSGPCGDGPIGQYNDSNLHKQARRDQVPESTRSNMDSASAMRETGDPPTSIPPLGETERESRRLVQARQQRMGALPTLGQPCFQSVRETIHQPFCNREQCSAPNLLLQEIPPEGVENRCVFVSMDRSPNVRISSLEPNTQSINNYERSGCDHDSRRTMLADATVVSSIIGITDRPAVPFSRGKNPSNPKERASLVPRQGKSSSFCLENIRLRFQAEGVSRTVAELAASSRRESTIRTYDCRLAKFNSWAEQNHSNPVDATVNQISAFLMAIFEEGKQVSTIRNYRSAIASVHKGFSDGSTVGSNNTIHHLLKGMFNTRPPGRTLPPSWSINDILRVLAEPPYEPMQDTSLELLTHKTLFLIAAASARRRGCLQALTLRPGHIRFENGGVRLIPDPQFLAKNQTMTFTPQEIFLPSLESMSTIQEDKRWCPVRALKWYMDKTKIVRKHDRLFLLPRSPYTPASKDTISRWIRDMIRPHVSQNERVRAHDVRGHATSRAWFNGVPLEEIMKAASWKTPTSFVSCYLTDTLSSEGTFARGALRPPPRK